MAKDNSYDVIKQMVADDYIAGLFKDPDMRADMERVEAEEAKQSKWGELTQELGSVQTEPPASEKEMER